MMRDGVSMYCWLEGWWQRGGGMTEINGGVTAVHFDGITRATSVEGSPRGFDGDRIP